MIEFTHNYTDFGNIMLECKGHSGNRGSSLVCAGASTLMFACCKALDRMASKKLEVTTGDGYMRIFCLATPETYAATNVAIAGMKMLAEQYPEDVKIVNFRKK